MVVNHAPGYNTNVSDSLCGRTATDGKVIGAVLRPENRTVESLVDYAVLTLLAHNVPGIGPMAQTVEA